MAIRSRRIAALVARDVRRGYYTPEQARELFGVALASDGEIDAIATAELREAGGIARGATSSGSLHQLGE